MESKKHALSTRFAEYLVGSMLQRSGAQFCQVASPTNEFADFLVTIGDHTVTIKVKYADNSDRALSEWANWSSTLPRNKKSHTPHLVIVTGTGDTVYADPSAAPLLQPDARTKLSVMSPAPQPTASR